MLFTLTSLLSGCQDPNAEPEEAVASSDAETTVSEEKETLDPNKKYVAITFDDGPHNVWTKQIVNELGRYGFTATFFVLGNRIDGSAYNGGDTMAFVASQGHEIAIHGYTHEVYYNKCTDEEYEFELSKTAEVITKWGGGTPTLMRPIGGAISNERVTVCPYSVILWDVDSEDWRYKYKSGDSEEAQKEKVDTIVQNVMSNVREGSIILLHDIYESTYDATCIILERLHAEGYTVVSVSELLGEPISGKIYYGR